MPADDEAHAKLKRRGSYVIARMDNYAEYSGKNLRYSLEGGELRINALDLCSILAIEPHVPDTLDLATAIEIALSHDIAVSAWLLETFKGHAPTDLEGPLAWLYSQMRSYLRAYDEK
jgi:hypothetical protein